MQKLLSFGTVATIIFAGANGSVLAFPNLRTERIQHNLSATALNKETVSLPPALVSTDRITTQQIDLETLLGIAAVGAGTAGIVWANRLEQPQKSSGSQSYYPGIEEASPHLQKKLLRLLHNDHKTAKRLLVGAKMNHPDRSVNWLAEKVIYDLERDLGRY